MEPPLLLLDFAHGSVDGEAFVKTMISTICFGIVFWVLFHKKEEA